MGHLNVGTPRLVGRSHSKEGSRVLRPVPKPGDGSLEPFSASCRTERPNGPKLTPKIPKHARIRTDCTRMEDPAKVLAESSREAPEFRRRHLQRLQAFGRPLRVFQLGEDREIRLPAYAGTAERRAGRAKKALAIRKKNDGSGQSVAKIQVENMSGHDCR